MENEEESWEETSTRYVWWNRATGMYVFSDECSQFSEQQFETEADAATALKLYAASL